jgi:release factor glutamine methyltransferase
MSAVTNSKTLFHQLKDLITLSEEEDEIRSILYLVFEKEFGLSRTDILAEKSIKEPDSRRLTEIVSRINQSEPIQYILQESYFFNRKFFVNKAVLIPRPETELIVSLIQQEPIKPTRILDIGTGSGCLAITLALEFPASSVYGIDVSQEALAVANKNAQRLGATVDFVHADILKNLPSSISNVDLIVSNPPYIMEKEKVAMNENVLGYEPGLALFVPNDNPLIFYKEIAKKGIQFLRSGGKVFVEINQLFGNEVKEVFERLGYQVSIFKDISGKDRVVRGVL